MNRQSRRDFVKGAGSLVGGIAFSSALGPGSLAGSPLAEDLTIPRVTLGRTGERVSRLGVGCAHFGRRNVGVEDVRKVLLRGLDLGVDYLDVAPNYGNEEEGFSEEKMGPVMRDIRKKVFLVTKTEEPTREGTWKLLRQSMKRLQTDYFDLVHLHNFGHEPRFPDIEAALGEDGALGALLEAQKKGVVRYIGASGHLHPSRFHAVLDTGKIDVLMNAVNLATQHTYDFEHKVWSRARRENLALVAMKVLGGRAGNAFRLPAELYDKAIRYALSIPGVTLAVIGLKNVPELEKAAKAIAAFTPLTPEESLDLARKGLELVGTEERWRLPYGEPVT